MILITLHAIDFDLMHKSRCACEISRKRTCFVYDWRLFICGSAFQCSLHGCFDDFHRAFIATVKHTDKRFRLGISGWLLRLKDWIRRHRTLPDVFTATCKASLSAGFPLIVRERKPPGLHRRLSAHSRQSASGAAVGSIIVPIKSGTRYLASRIIYTNGLSR